MLVTKIAMLLTYGLFAYCTLVVFRSVDVSARYFRAIVSVFGSASGLYFGFLTLNGQSTVSASASLVLFIAALALLLSSLREIGKLRLGFAGSTTAPPSLLTTGPYRVVRHPIYVAYIVGWTAGLLNAISPREWAIGAVLWMAMAAIYSFAARQEERTIAQGEFGRAHADYAARTGMFVPYLFWGVPRKVDPN